MEPLVEPGPELEPAEVLRYSRHVLLPELGATGQRRLKNARVLVVGAGGLGSPVLMYLAAAGVGTIGIVDDDVVDVSNLQRQIIHSEQDVGRRKVDSAAGTLAGVNPHVRVVRHAERMTRDTALGLIGDYDLVLDGTDTFTTRYLVNDACAVLGKPLVWGSIFRFDGQVSVFWSAPPEGSEPVTYRDLHPVPPPAGSVPSCAEGGVLGVVCAAIGSVMATEALKLICGIGEPLLGRLMVFDALGMSWRTIGVRASSPPVTALEADYAAFCGISPASTDGNTISAAELAAWLAERDRGERDFVLVDVREPAEREIALIPGAVSVPLALVESDPARVLKEAAGERPLVLHCKSGGRSARALELARGNGFPEARHLAGGVLAWIDEVDPGQPRY
jgi:sulfur-carrier protein adenylyltransferase/sulfurtransferase